MTSESNNEFNVQVDIRTDELYKVILTKRRVLLLVL